MERLTNTTKCLSHDRRQRVKRKPEGLTSSVHSVMAGQGPRNAALRLRGGGGQKNSDLLNPKFEYATDELGSVVFYTKLS